MTEFEIHTIESAPQEARGTLEAARQNFGFLPNLLGELAAAPAALKGYVTLSELLSESSLRPIEQQLVLIAASLENGCNYCVAAHSAGLKASGGADDQIDAVRSGRPLADPKLEALRAFTTAIVNRRGLVTDAELHPFLAAGYAREQVFDVLLGVAMKTLSNYTNHIAHTPLDRPLEAFEWEPANA
jgi:uncharacterized peroxidase-related enzyme